MMKNLYTLFVLSLFGALSIFQTGCETVRDFTDNNPSVAKGAVQYATLKYINGEAERAEDVKTTVTDIRNAASNLNNFTTVEGLETLARAQVSWDKLAPEDVILANLIIEETARRIKVDIDREYLNPDDLVTLEQYLTWVEEAADLYLNNVSEEEILGSYVPVEQTAAEKKGFNLFHFATGAKGWDALVAWWQTPATIENVQASINAQQATGGVNPQYQFWAWKHGYEVAPTSN